jgi:hypothetical protein
MLVASDLKLLFTKINFSCVRLMRFDSKDYSALTGALAQWGPIDTPRSAYARDSWLTEFP